MFLQISDPHAVTKPTTPVRTLGIDLGTTHTVVAVCEDGVPRIVTGEDGRLIPSVVSYGEATPRVGHDALQDMHAVSSIKRQMGKPFVAHDPIVVSAHILAHAKAQAESILGQVFDSAVITVPAYFDEKARVATKEAARLAGLRVLRLLNEPTAAALAYGLQEGAQGHYMVYDLGGGTFDVSLLKMADGIFQVLATGGDRDLGGDDFDALIAENLTRLGAADSPVLHTHARCIKAFLSENDLWEGQVAGVSVRLARTDVEDLLRPAIQRTIHMMQDLLEDAGLTPKDLQGIVLVGGSTRIPLIHRMLTKAFGRAPKRDLHPDEAVALGAAFQAHMLVNGSEHLLLDVTPLSLGLETYGGLVEKIIPRHTALPACKTQTFSTAVAGQWALSLNIVQGERELAKDCRSLARFDLQGIPPMPQGAPRLEVSFMLDADGLLTVSAVEKTTGVRQSIEVHPTVDLQVTEMAHMVLEAQAHGREDMEARLLIQARQEAAELIQVTREAMQMDAHLLTAEESAAMTTALQQLEQIEASTDRLALETAQKALEQVSQAFGARRIDYYLTQHLKGVQIDAA